MKLTIIYDNELFLYDRGLQADWGFGCLIETPTDTILFDTGANGNILLKNLAILRLNPNKITKIVISHQHHDHVGGLAALIPFLQEATVVYHLSDNCPNDMMLSIFPKEPKKIGENVWTTGLIKGGVDEQSLVLKAANGWCVVTGCSHPGVEKILLTAKTIGNIIGIIGGFHSFNNYHVINKLDFICPCHCTQHKREIKKLYPQRYLQGGVGKTIEI